MDSAWVRVLLLDDNDNSPRFATSRVNLTLPEDAQLGHSLASFIASDIDQVCTDCHFPFSVPSLSPVRVPSFLLSFQFLLLLGFPSPLDALLASLSLPHLQFLLFLVSL